MVLYMLLQALELGLGGVVLKVEDVKAVLDMKVTHFLMLLSCIIIFSYYNLFNRNISTE